MADYKVVKEEGIQLEGVEEISEKDSVVVLDAEAEQTKQLLEDGSIEAVVVEEKVEEEKKVEDGEGGAAVGGVVSSSTNGERHPLA